MATRATIPAPAEPHAALILGLVLGLILAGTAVLVVVGGKLWRSQSALFPPTPVILPIYSADPPARVAGGQITGPTEYAPSANAYAPNTNQ